ncbi:sugar phosphate isomerase/epimerase [Candidatus Poribacteria bacterium]|nr:sugar phosphate isomerase/epimerase [Candidatus Poribacteria bacterium]
MSRPLVGLQLYTVRNEAAKDFVGVVKQVAAMGYEGVETAVPPGMTAEGLRKLLDDLGLKTPGGHYNLEALEKDLNAAIELSQTLGTKFITVPYLAEERRRDADGWKRVAGIMSGIGEKLAAHGIVFCYHNHSFEFQQFDGKYGLDILYENSDPRYLKAQLDTYWVRHGGADPAAYIRKMKGRAPLIHLKDWDKADGSFAEVGEGTLDWKGIFAAAEDGGAEWYLVEQDTCKRPPIESARLSCDNLRKMGKLS